MENEVWILLWVLYLFLPVGQFLLVDVQLVEEIGWRIGHQAQKVFSLALVVLVARS